MYVGLVSDLRMKRLFLSMENDIRVAIAGGCGGGGGVDLLICVLVRLPMVFWYIRMMKASAGEG